MSILDKAELTTSSLDASIDVLIEERDFFLRMAEKLQDPAYYQEQAKTLDERIKALMLERDAAASIAADEKATPPDPDPDP